MAYIKIQEGDKIVTNIRKWRTDSYDDLALIKATGEVKLGDTIYILDGAHKGEIYQINGSGNWVIQ